MMDAKTRAVKINDHLREMAHNRKTVGECEEFIAAQIAEAEREAVRTSVNTFSLTKQEVDKCYAEGFRAAREKALPKWAEEIEICPDDCSDIDDLKQALAVAMDALESIRTVTTEIDKTLRAKNALAEIEKMGEGK